MRFTVVGADAAGLSMEFVLEARCVEEAEHLARQRGVSVASVTLRAGSGSASPSVPARHPTTEAIASPVVVAGGTLPAECPAVPNGPDLGLISLALGGAALMFCWIPTVGIISLGLGALGAAAGTIALARTCRRSDRSRRAPGARLITPIIGVGLSVVTLLAAGMLAGAADAGTASASTGPTPGQPAKPPAASAARNLTIVAARPAAEPAQRTDPAPQQPPANPMLSLGDAEVRVVACDLTNIPLIDDQGRSQGISKRPMIAVRVEVRNTGAAPIEYRTLSGDGDAGLRDAARLVDERGGVLPRIRLPLSVSPVGRVVSERLEPGRSLTDVLVFESPSVPASRLTLWVPGDAVGASGSGEIGVPAPVKR